MNIVLMNSSLGYQPFQTLSTLQPQAGSTTGTPAPVVDEADSSHEQNATPSAQQALNQQVLASLQSTLESDGLALPTLDQAADFAPEKVAERILGFIQGALAGLPETQRDEVLQQARAGVEQGFAEARGILDELGVLGGEIAANVDRTYGLIQAGLERLAAPSDPPPAVQSAAVASLQSLSYETSQTTRIQIETRDGDRVTIDVSRLAGVSRSSIALEGASLSETGAQSLSLRATQESRYTSASLAYSVQGELDADEEKAIGQLIKRIDHLSDRFYAGNVQAAFKQAVNLNYDRDELAGFSLSLEQTVSRQAVSAYAEVAGQSAVSPATELAGYLGEMRSLFEQPAASRLAEPEKGIGDLLEGITRARAESEGGLNALQERALGLLKELIQGMSPEQEHAEVLTESVAEPEEAEAA